VRQRDDGLSPTERRNLSAGDIITWDVLKVPAGSPESQPPAATGTISGLYEGGVLIDRNRRGWPDFRIPTDAITSHFIVNQSEVEQSEPPRRRSRRGGQTEAGAAKAASARRESALTRQLRSEIETLEAQIGKLTGDLRKATQAKHSAKGFQKSAGERRLEQARDEIKELQAELLDVNREVQHLHEIAASERPLQGQEFHMKTRARGNPLPDNVRDLLVNFRTQLGLAGEKSLEAGGTDRRGGGTGWTLDAVKNQLRLWNLRRPEWSELEVDMFSKVGLIEPGKAFNLSGTRAVLVKRLRLILTTQRAAERRQAVLDTAMRRLDQEQEEERVAQEQADSVAERQSRRGRGENAWRTRG
jgi:hypothetical protein